MLDEKEMIERFAGEREILIDVGEVFLESSLDNLNLLKEGYKNNDLDVVAKQAHTLKGASGNFTLDIVYPTCVEIEESIKNGNLSEDSILRLENELKQLHDFLKTIISN